jgi:hypothetical protein
MNSIHGDVTVNMAGVPQTRHKVFVAQGSVCAFSGCKCVQSFKQNDVGSMNEVGIEFIVRIKTMSSSNPF